MSIFNANYPPQTFYINSNDRIQGTSSSFICKPLDFKGNKYTHCCVKQVSVPKVFPNIPTSYNTFTLKEGVQSVQIVLAVGYYTKSIMQSVLPTLLNASSPNGWIYSISYKTSTEVQDFKFTFSVSGNASQPSFVFTDNDIWLQLGFDVGTYAFVGNTLKSQNIINFNPTSKLYIKSDLSASSNESILQEVLGVDLVQFGGSVYFEQNGNYDLDSKVLVGNQKNSFSIQLVNENNQLVDLQGQDWSLSIVFYVRNDTSDLIREDLKIKTMQRIAQSEEKSLLD
jgi:hypothetical protein